MTVILSGVAYAHPGGHQALHPLDLQLAAGEQVALIGPSGAGKTTLLRILASILPPAAGSARLLDTDPWQLSGRQRQRMRSRIGLIHQSPPLPPRQRVITAVLAGRLGQWSLPRALLNLLCPLDPQGARDALTGLDLGERLYQLCNQLSGGQLQRVGIARTLYQRPELMLADEPVSAMDPVLAEHTLRVLSREARSRNTTLVASLHAVDLALNHFPRVIGLRDGRIAFDCPREQVSPQMLDALYANALLDSQDPAPDGLKLSPLCTARC